MKYLQNRKVLFGVIAILAILIVSGGAWFFLGSKGLSNQAGQTQSGSQSGDQMQIIGTLSPSDIGLQLVLRNDNKAIKFVANKLEGIKSLEWNFTYQADIPLSDQNQYNQGQKVTQEFGSDNPVILNGKTSYSSQFRELGTCSSGVCRYDTGVTSVQLEMKITKLDGSIYKVDDSINIPQG